MNDEETTQTVSVDLTGTILRDTSFDLETWIYDRQVDAWTAPEEVAYFHLVALDPNDRQRPPTACTLSNRMYGFVGLHRVYPAHRSVALVVDVLCVRCSLSTLRSRFSSPIMGSSPHPGHHLRDARTLLLLDLLRLLE